MGNGIMCKYDHQFRSVYTHTHTLYVRCIMMIICIESNSIGNKIAKQNQVPSFFSFSIATLFSFHYLEHLGANTARLLCLGTQTPTRSHIHADASVCLCSNRFFSAFFILFYLNLFCLFICAKQRSCTHARIQLSSSFFL